MRKKKNEENKNEENENEENKNKENENETENNIARKGWDDLSCFPQHAKG